MGRTQMVGRSEIIIVVLNLRAVNAPKLGYQRKSVESLIVFYCEPSAQGFM